MSHRRTCTRNSDCNGYKSFCDTVIHYCEPCYKHICDKRSHPNPTQCCRNCPEYAKEAGYDCSSVKSTKAVKTTKSGIVTISEKRPTSRKTKPSTARITPNAQPQRKNAKNWAIKTHVKKLTVTRAYSTIISDVGTKNEKLVAGGELNVQRTQVNPWLYTTVILAATFLILVLCVAFILIFMRKSKKRKSKESQIYQVSGSNCQDEERVMLNNISANLKGSDVTEKSNSVNQASDHVYNDSAYCQQSCHSICQQSCHSICQQSCQQKRVNSIQCTTESGQNKNLLDSGITST